VVKVYAPCGESIFARTLPQSLCDLPLIFACGLLAAGAGHAMHLTTVFTEINLFVSSVVKLLRSLVKLLRQ
jgi:hypothetical protein